MGKLHMVLRLKTPYGASMVAPIAMRRRSGQATVAARRYQIKPSCSLSEMQLPAVLPLPMKEPLVIPDTDRYFFNSFFLLVLLFYSVWICRFHFCFLFFIVLSI
jgi:hypothetical protein